MTKSENYLSYGFKTSLECRLYIVLTAIAYPIIIYAFFPEFKDYQNYIVHVEKAEVLLGRFGILVLQGSPSALFAEPLWPAILFCLKLIFWPAVVLGIIVGLSFLLLLSGLSKLNKRPWINLILVLVFYPIAIMYFMQIRQGFALAIYMWSYSLNSKKGWYVRFLTPFIHYSTFIILFVEAAYNFFKYFKLSKRLLIGFSSICALILVSIVPILVNILGAMGFVSGAFELQAPQVSGLGAIIWSFYGGALFLLSRPSKELAMSIVGILVFLFSQFYIDIGSRLLQLFIPFIIASFSYRSKKIQLLIAITIATGLILWLPTIMDPGRIFLQ